MNRVKALKAAQARQLAEAEQGKMYGMHIRDNSCELITESGKSFGSFPFEDPEPLPRNSLAMCFDGLLRYALGDTLNGIHKFAKPGYDADTNFDNGYDGLKDGEFEIIELPDEFDTIPTPDDICTEKRCPQYPEKWQRTWSEKYLHSDCQKCTVKTSTPTRMKKNENM